MILNQKLVSLLFLVSSAAAVAINNPSTSTTKVERGHVENEGNPPPSMTTSTSSDPLATAGPTATSTDQNSRRSAQLAARDSSMETRADKLRANEDVTPDELSRILRRQNDGDAENDEGEDEQESEQDEPGSEEEQEQKH